MYNSIEDELACSEAEVERCEAEQLHKPKIVFKYKSVSSCTDLERICHILSDNRIYMPKYDELNDPLEGKNSVMLNKNYAARRSELEKYRILSLSENGLLSALWAHYAGNYSGICLGYKTSEMFSCVEKIEYVKKQTQWNVDPFISVLEDLKIKSVEWEHEQEWRLIKQSKDLCDSHLCYKQDVLACVLFGCKMSTLIQDIIKKYENVGIKAFTVYPDENKFCLYAKCSDSDQHIYSMDELYSCLGMN